jgi:hypothetical protein
MHGLCETKFVRIQINCIIEFNIDPNVRKKKIYLTIVTVLTKKLNITKNYESKMLLQVHDELLMFITMN